ncbi:MAG: LacI family transcriptional regulator [Bacteroidetes bacterium]|nr:LacI family transcriptional regulator [Bacteroidota bacterium]
MRRSQITIKDIARRLSVSSSTVSRALRNHPDISIKTKKQVLCIASEFNYQPNGIAQSLKNMRTNTIGVIVPEIKHDFFPTALDGIEDVTYKAGYTIIVCKSNESYGREVLNTRALASNRIAGLIVSISQDTQNFDHFKSLINQNIPIVFFDRACNEIDSSKVLVDDFEGAFSAVNHLIERGYKRIAHLAGPKHLSISQSRLNGYLTALNKHNLPLRDELIIHGGLHRIDGRTGVKRLLTLEKRPDAIFAVNGPVQFGAFMQIKGEGYKIPEEIGIIGFSDDPISSLVDPPLSTVGQPAYEMGAAAANLLLEEINHKEDFFEPKIQILKTKLIIRQSS